jgi:hypothetical protein
LYFKTVGHGSKRREYVYTDGVILEGTLIPAGGRFITHYDYLAAKAAGNLPVPWLQVEDPDPNSHGALWFDPVSENPLVVALHNHVLGACASEEKYVNLRLVWSVFPSEGFSSSSRIFYQAVKDIPQGRRLCAPPLSQCIQAHPWTEKSRLSARVISFSLQAGGSVPVGDQWGCYLNGDVGRPDLIYGSYTHLEADSGGFAAVAVRPSRGVDSTSSVGASSVVPVDLAVQCGLPASYHGVVVQPVPTQQILTLAPAFMDGSYVPGDESFKPPATMLLEWWVQVCTGVRASYTKKRIPDDLRAAMKTRQKMYEQHVRESGGSALSRGRLSSGSPVVAVVSSISAAVSSTVAASAQPGTRLPTSSRRVESSKSLVGVEDVSSAVDPPASRKRMRSGASAVTAVAESSAAVPRMLSASVSSRNQVQTSSQSRIGRARAKEELLSRLAEANTILSRAQADLDNARARYTRLLSDLSEFLE